MYARFIRTPTHFKVTVTVTVTPLYGDGISLIDARQYFTPTPPLFAKKVAI